jgi:stage III sporulation protein AA
MELQPGAKPFDQATAHLPGEIAALLGGVHADLRSRVTEIRMRAGGALTLTTPEGVWFFTTAGRPTPLLPSPCLRLTGAQLQQVLRQLCEYSIHSFADEIVQGFVTLPGGHRAGICGTAVAENGKITAVRAFSSINLRVAREVPGAAAELCAQLFAEGRLPGVLVAGVPGSGKTTLLRDLARRISEGVHGPCRRVCLLDERGELAGARNGTPCCNVGAGTDVLTGYPKGEGVLLALRSLAPEVILCDELGGAADIAALETGGRAGVRFVATIHAGSAEEALAKPALQPLLAEGVFDALVQLRGADCPCAIAKIADLRERNVKCRSNTLR